MQTVAVDTIVKDVKLVLDENIATNSVLETDANQLELEALIRSRVIDAVRYVHESASSDMLDDGLVINNTPVTLQDGSGYVVLPNDFMRMVVFQLTTWNRPVIEPIADTDPRYFMQKSRFLGIRGGTDKPICAITTGETGRVLEFYSVAPGTTAQVKKAKYLPLPEITESGSILVCKKLYTAIVWQCAGYVALVFDDTRAKAYMDVAKSFL